MKRTWYSDLNKLWSAVLKEKGPVCRLREGRWLSLFGFLDLFVTFWWWGSVGSEALLCLAMFGAIWGGDSESGSDELPRRQGSMLSFLDSLFMRHRPRWLPPEVRGDVAPGVPEVAETEEDALAEELLGLGLDELGRFIGGAVGWMKDLQSVMWDWQKPRDERFQAAAEHRAIYDVALDRAKRGQGVLTDIAQGRQSVGEGIRELFEKTDPLPIAQAVEEVQRERRPISQEPDIWAPGDMPFDVPDAGPIPEPAELPREIPKIVTEHPPLEGRFFERAKEIDAPRQHISDILSFSPPNQYLAAMRKARDFAARLKEERLVGPDVRDEDIRNTLQHFIASYSITRDFGSPRLTWDLGAFNELIISPITGWLAGSTKEEIARDTETDYYHNRLGIEEAIKHSGKDVSLYELVRRLAKEGKFRY